MENTLNQEKANEMLTEKEKKLCDNYSNQKGKCKALIVHGTKYKTLYTNKYENRKKWQKPNEKQIMSFIPGTINEVFVRDGEHVRKEQPLLVLEAMKMENTIFAPIDGQIKVVQVKKNDKVPKGLLMIEFE
jgi:biotin carboxyl carrier protein